MLKLLSLIGLVGVLALGMVLFLHLPTVSAIESEATAQRGMALFNDPALGTNGKTCRTCHLNGRGLDHAGERPDLTTIVNGCISASLKGKPIDVNSIEMQSLILYIKQLSQKRSAPNGPPHIGC